MILYNFPYRGPFEYDKFVLNIFQFHNDVVFMEEKLLSAANTNIGLLEEQKQVFDEFYNSCIHDASLSQQCYLLSLSLS